MTIFAATDGLTAEVSDHRDLSIITVHLFLEARYVSFVNVVQDLLDRLIDDLGILGGHRTVENPCSADTLIDYCIGRLLHRDFRLPEGVYLEPVLKVLVKDWDERHGLLSPPLAEQEKMLKVLSAYKLPHARRVYLWYLCDYRPRVVKFSIILYNRRHPTDIYLFFIRWMKSTSSLR